MNIIIGLFIIAIGAFCQSSCYVPINKIKDWSWESYWVIQGVFAWLILPFLGALLAVPAGHSLWELFTTEQSFNIWMTIFFGVLWGIGGLTFGLSMRYLGVALGQSIALGTCAGLGTILGPVLLNIFFPDLNALESLTFAVILGVVVTLIGIAIIGIDQFSEYFISKGGLPSHQVTYFHIEKLPSDSTRGMLSVAVTVPRYGV